MTTNSTLERLNVTTRYDNVSSDIGLLVLRVVFGGLLAAHGAQKLFGWFDGPGLSANSANFEAMGYNPGDLFGTLAGLSEFAGGLLLLLGLFTPLAAAIVLGTMINVIHVMWGGGMLDAAAGYEMGLLFATVAVAVAFTGPGRFSLDHGRPWYRAGVAWGVGAVALAVVTGVLTLILKGLL
ncbi:DoxX family protein [Nocardia cyriacigeorgica]|uniref:DoxX n=1 Tax=Nocardia cyriacigeorgica TaxID=135487 RepID=A0A4U8W687_9NOCA|nr:DoxX family protein [Nocardia cyriacigeorgica]MBF6102221.1 DoxX family protein [Nocardia cyriacigeorgica]MBF6317514.1 DoxX family protein [Nocardia cyriacigeorgica]MBF6515681.1 DoxX family protein [Nocardia cyriacigeorgica]MBF6533294.1 DoxX family protein [Nocardia cyriacigeorgica]TLF53968.1 DoxX family protein [Nocardia cyriacigeorgica]